MKTRKLGNTGVDIPAIGLGHRLELIAPVGGGGRHALPGADDGGAELVAAGKTKYGKEFPMDDMTAVRLAVDRLLGGDLGPMLDLLAADVEFEVAGAEIRPNRKDWGKEAVADHFTGLGELVAFWQIDYGAVDGQVIAWGKESFTVEHSGLEGACEFALVFDLSRGMITRFLVIEDLTSFFRRGGSLVEASAA
jgi:hypothetical protein